MEIVESKTINYSEENKFDGITLREFPKFIAQLNMRLDEEGVSGLLDINYQEADSLYHPSVNVMEEAIKEKLWKNIPEWLEVWMIDAVYRKHSCLLCAIALWHQLPMQIGSGVHYGVIGTAWAFDYQGPYNPPTMYGCTGYFKFYELSIGLKIPMLVKEKSESLEKCVNNLQMENNKFGHTIRTLRNDSGSVELSDKFETICAKLKILSIPAPPNSQYRNPVEGGSAEYTKGHVNMVILSQQNLKAAHWGSAVLGEADAVNQLPNSLCRNHPTVTTPHEAFYRQRLDVEEKKMFPWGQAAIVKQVIKTKIS